MYPPRCITSDAVWQLSRFYAYFELSKSFLTSLCEDWHDPDKTFVFWSLNKSFLKHIFQQEVKFTRNIHAEWIVAKVGVNLRTANVLYLSTNWRKSRDPQCPNKLQEVTYTVAYSRWVDRIIFIIFLQPDIVSALLVLLKVAIKLHNSALLKWGWNKETD